MKIVLNAIIYHYVSTDEYNNITSPYYGDVWMTKQ